MASLRDRKSACICDWRDCREIQLALEGYGDFRAGYARLRFGSDEAFRIMLARHLTSSPENYVATVQRLNKALCAGIAKHHYTLKQLELFRAKKFGGQGKKNSSHVDESTAVAASCYGFPSPVDDAGNGLYFLSPHVPRSAVYELLQTLQHEKQHCGTESDKLGSRTENRAANVLLQFHSNKNGHPIQTESDGHDRNDRHDAVLIDREQSTNRGFERR